MSRAEGGAGKAAPRRADSTSVATGHGAPRATERRQEVREGGHRDEQAFPRRAPLPSIGDEALDLLEAEWDDEPDTALVDFQLEVACTEAVQQLDSDIDELVREMVR